MTMGARDGYKSLYQRLDSATHEIRLLQVIRPQTPTAQRKRLPVLLPTLDLTKLESSHSQTSATCKLVTFRLSEAPAYRALSYTWGDAKPTHALQVNDKWLPVCQNLTAGLQAICSKNLWLDYLWVDAICINQDDDDEKSTQVPIMSKIYHGAHTVIVWLGEELPSTARAFSFLETSKACGLHIELSNMIHGTGVKPGTTAWQRTNQEVEYILTKAKSLDTEADRHAARELLQKNPYWTRVWVLQELAHARQAVFVCGASHIIHSDDLETAALFWKKARVTAMSHDGALGWDHGIDSFFTVREILFRTRSRAMSHTGSKSWAFDYETVIGDLLHPVYEDVFRLFVDTRSYRASDPRDKFYALLNLMPAEHGFLRPDYQCGEAVLYPRIVRQGVEFRDSLWCISLGGVGVFDGPRSFGLPSWVPDFPKIGDKSLKYPGPVTMLGYKSYGLFRASGSRKTNYTFLPSERLRAEGFICDRIDVVVPADPHPTTTFQNICKALRTFDVRHGGDTSIYGRLFRTLFPVELKAELEPILSTPHGRSCQDCWMEIASAFMMEIAAASAQNYRDTHGGGGEAGGGEAVGGEAMGGEFGGDGQDGGGFALVLEDGTPEEAMVMGFGALEYGDVAIGYGILPHLAANGADSDESLHEVYQRAHVAFGEDMAEDYGLPENMLIKFHDKAASEKFSVDSGLTRFLVAFHKYWSNRAFVVTEGGRLGLVQQGTRKGDEVCILHGCPVPLVIRKEEEDHVLVGDCYVEGMMAGQMVKERDEGKFASAYITLR